MIRTLLTAVLPLASLGLMAVEGLTPDTIFNDIPGDATVREIVTTGGGGGGVSYGEMTAYVDAAEERIKSLPCTKELVLTPEQITQGVTFESHGANQNSAVEIGRGAKAALDQEKVFKISYTGGDGATKVVTLMEAGADKAFLPSTYYHYVGRVDRKVSQGDAPPFSSPLHATFTYETVNGSVTFAKDIEVK